jgi:uncharacterized protein
LLPFLVGGALGIPLGAEILRWATSPQMRTLIGLALVLFSVYSLARPKLPVVTGSRVADGVVGLLSGFLGGSTGLAGIPVIVWFGGSGMLTGDTIRLFLIGLPAVLLGTWLGFKLYGKLDETTFRTIVLVLLLISGLTLLPSAILAVR